MATTNSVTSNYQGNLAGEIFKQAFAAANTLDKNLITPVTNVIGSGFLPAMEDSGSFTAYGCGWNPTGEITYSEKEVVAKKLMSQREVCKDKFYATFQSQRDGLYKADNPLPADIKTALLDNMVSNLKNQINSSIWNGDNSTNSINGLFRQFSLDAEVIDVTAISGITKANVVQEIDRVFLAIPDKVAMAQNLVIVVSSDIAKSYKAAQASMGLNTTVGDKELNYLGVRLEVEPSFPVRTMVAYRVSNLGMVTGLQADFNEVRIADDEARLDGNILMKATFSLGAGYHDGSEIVYYWA